MQQWSLNREEYHLKNALLFGMCQAHFREVKSSTHFGRKFTHLVVGVIEAIPVVGQIVSLIELGIISFFVSKQVEKPAPQPTEPTQAEPTMPKLVFNPLPTNPEPTVTVSQGPGEICRKWPTDLSLLGITEDQRWYIDHVLALAGNCKMATGKKYIKIQTPYQEIELRLPITIQTHKENNEYRVFLLPKTPFKVGGERTLRWAYDLTNGQFLVKKKIVGIYERFVMASLIEKRESRGFSSYILWRTFNAKTSAIETLRAGTIQNLFGTEPLAEISVKRDLMIDLIDDLTELHALITSGDFPVNKQIVTVTDYPVSHLDISHNNTLISQQEGKWRAELCDFSPSGNATKLIYIIGYTSPEYIHFFKRFRPLGLMKPAPRNDYTEVTNFNYDYGQGRDIWALGLVFAALLAERTLKNPLGKGGEISPLPCLQARIASLPYQEDGFTTLTQEMIDTDLKALQVEVRQKHLQNHPAVDNLFELVGRMLRVNPKERPKANDLKPLIKAESFA